MSVQDMNEVEAMGDQSVSEVAAAMGRHAKRTASEEQPAGLSPMGKGVALGTAERDLTVVTLEIRTLHRQAQQMVLSYAIEIGRRLVEAKALVEYGTWGAYIKEELGYSQSTANNFMRLFEEYGKGQQSLFGGEAESQAFGNLTYTQALALLAVPAEEREEFVQAHDVEGMSTRELEAAIRARDEAQAALEVERGVNAELRSRTMDAENKAAEALEKARAERETQYDRAERLAQELEDLKHRPIDVAVEAADPEEVKKAVDAAVAAERERAKGETDKMSAKLDKAKAEREKLEEKLKAAEAKAQGAEAGANAEVEELRRQLAMADPVTAEFKGLFAQAGQIVARLLELAEQAPEDKRENLRAALTALGAQLVKGETGDA